jgi:hypothetical protein
MIIAGFFMLLGASIEPAAGGGGLRGLAAGGLLGSCGAALLVLGLAVRRFRRWARRPAIALTSVLFLAALAQMIRTAARGGRIGPEAIYLTVLALVPASILLLQRSAYVCSPEYDAIRAATPHLRYRAPVAVWLPMLLLIVVIGGWIWKVLSA